MNQEPGVSSQADRDGVVRAVAEWRRYGLSTGAAVIHSGLDNYYSEEDHLSVARSSSFLRKVINPGWGRGLSFLKC